MAPYFWNSPKVGKNEFKGQDFDFFPLENPLIKTTGRGPAGPLAGHPPSGTPATNYWRKCTTVRRTLTCTKTRGGALGSCTFIGTRVVFKGGAAIGAPPLARFSFHIHFACTKRIWRITVIVFWAATSLPSSLPIHMIIGSMNPLVIWTIPITSATVLQQRFTILICT